MRRVQLTGSLMRPEPPPGAVNVARPTRWGNPFAAQGHDPEWAVQMYREWLIGTPGAVELARLWRSRLRLHGPALVAAARAELAGKDLACWCPPEMPCHADLLIALLRTAPGEPVPAVP